MASFNRVTFSGSTDTISVPFGYLDKSHVVVSLNGVVLASGAYSWPSNGQVKITAGNPAAGVVGEARRVTPASPLVNFEPGNLDTDDLDTASLQAIYIAEEAKDSTSDINTRVWYSAGFQTGGTITKGSLDVVPKFDAAGNLIPGPSVAEVSTAQAYAVAALGYRNEAENFSIAAATFNPANFYTKTQADGIFATITSVSGSIATINNALGNRVQVDAAQSFSTAQQDRGRANIGVQGRNLIINGQGRINQRVYASGVATTGANQFTLDRWFVLTSGQNLSFTGDDSRRVMTAPAGGVAQVIEGSSVVGGTYVLNWTGTATATVNGTARTKGEAFTLPANTNVTVRFSGGTFTDVQLELASVPSVFERLSFSQELLNCCAFYEKSYNYSVAPGTLTQVGQFSFQQASAVRPISFVPFKARKRGTPTVTIRNPVTATQSLRSVDNSADYTFTLQNQGEGGFGIFPSSGATGSTAFQWEADAEITS